MINKHVYIIASPDEMTFSDGRTPPVFGRTPYIWSNRRDVEFHITQVDDMYGEQVYDRCKIFECALVVEQIAVL